VFSSNTSQHPSEQNPADWVTRGKTAHELDEFWFNGPKWLKQSTSNWPTKEYANRNNCEMESRIVEIGLANIEETTPSPFGIDINRFSDFERLIRITAICIAFCAKLKRKIVRTRLVYSRIIYDVAELVSAEKMWIMYVQKNAYPRIIEALKKRKPHDMMQLGLELTTDQLIVCSGRLGHAKYLDEATQKPFLLHKANPFTHLLLWKIHLYEGHSGEDQTLSSLRKRYWVPAVRWTIRKLISGCVECRKWQGKMYRQPRMPELPAARVTPHPAFTYTGIDYFGPMQVRHGSTTKKVWVALFTCLTVRAIHLELVQNMTAEEFLLALRRFFARRGRPQRVVTDNGPQFGVASSVCKTWKDVVSDPDIINFCANQSIQWSFITAYSPWMGGVFERAVGIVKNPLRKVMGKSLMNISQLQTVLCEVEAIVNNRPLTYVGDKFPEIQPITPRHFLTLNPNNQVALTSFDEELFQTRTQEAVVELWKKGENLLSEFWKVWHNDYLLNLRSRLQYDHKSKRSVPFAPCVGHVVLVKEKGLPRGSWRIGRIAELCPSSDGLVRSVSVKLPTGRIVRRPVNLLCPFETTGQIEVCNQNPEMTENPTVEQKLENNEVNNVESEALTTSRSRPQRDAALKARARWHWWNDPFADQPPGSVVEDDG
jgi:transposase InsO family protein